MTPRYYALSDIARLTGKSYNWISRSDNREKLYAHGFPRPENLPGRPQWLARKVDAFFNPTPPKPLAQAANDRTDTGMTGLDTFLHG